MAFRLLNILTKQASLFNKLASNNFLARRYNHVIGIDLGTNNSCLGIKFIGAGEAKVGVAGSWAGIGQKRWAHNIPCTYDFARERIMLILRLFDKIDPEKLTLDSHFQNDLGLDSLDHVEIIIHLEDEFLFEIPDQDAEKLITPRHILTYITDHEEAYEELQKIHAAQPHHEYDHHLIVKPKHDHHHHHGDGHTDVHHSSHNHSNGDLKTNHQQTRGFSTLTRIEKRFSSNGKKWPTTFDQNQPQPINFDDIQKRVIKVCSKYDKIDSSKLELSSHFVQDLGLDSLDHVEILMEIEDEFGLEIPDKEAETLMRPSQIAAYVFKIEEARSIKVEDRPY